jgi:tRNA(Ile)-lysidine synthase
MLNTALIPHNSHLVIALSGGPDSVYLLHALQEVADSKGLSLTAAHLDHQWRTDSAQDVLFCQTLCEQLKIPFVTAKISDLSITFKDTGSKEDLGRRYRRHFLQIVRQEKGADFIALAHHADDQRETFFLRLLRGSSLTGLTGMKAVDGFHVRPLLGVSKQEILAFLDRNKIPYLNDPSNTSDKFLRNRIRNDLIPAFKLCDNRFETTFTNTFARLQQTEDFLQEMTLKTLKELEQEKGLLIPAFLELHAEMQYRVLIAWLCQEKVKFPVSQGFLDEIIRFLKESPQTSHTLMNSWKLVRNNQWVVLQKKQFN